MSLRVDLILASEQRSGSMLSPKSLLRIGSIVGPAALGLVVVWFVMNLMQVRSGVTSLEEQWRTLEPKKKGAEALKQQAARTQGVLDELRRWGTARMPWSTQLAGLVREAPANVQLHSLRISQILEPGEKGVPARHFTLILDGRAQGAEAESEVQVLQRRLQQSEPFAAAVRKEGGVQVPKFAADPSPQANRNDRVFQMTVAYNPKAFDLEAPRKP